jgi:hypothetical protein
MIFKQKWLLLVRQHQMYGLQADLVAGKRVFFLREQSFPADVWTAKPFSEASKKVLFFKTERIHFNVGKFMQVRHDFSLTCSAD